MGDHLEVEAKYSVASEAVLPDFDDLLGVATVEPPVSQDLVADYFDTEDLRLARLGITLRRRTGGEDAGWHLKVPVGKARYEAHEPLAADRVPPQPVVDALAGVVRGRSLSPVVTIRTCREVHRLRDAGGSVLAEVADDRVRAERWGPSARATAWREWEVELVEGGTALLQQVSRRLEGSGARAATHGSKLARALAGGVSAGSAHVEDGDTHGRAREVVWGRLRDLVDQLLRWDVLVRRDVDDSVHQMRVTVRRLRSVLATFRPLYDRDRTEPLRAELRWLGALLGEARDAEVLRDRIGSLSGEDPRLIDQGTITVAHQELARRYLHHHDRLVQELRSDRYAALADDLERLVTDPPWVAGGDDPTAGALRKRVRHDWKRVVAAVARSEADVDVAVRQRRLHEARRAAKRARYAAEPLVQVYGADAQRFVEATTQVQDALGDLNDALIAMERLPRLLTSESGGDHVALTLDVLLAREQEAADESEVRFEKAWPRARREKVLRWLS